MDITFEIDKIMSLLFSFYKMTNVVFTLCDTAFTHKASSDIPCDFCLIINDYTPDECHGSDTYNTLKSHDKKAYRYMCHAGLIEIIYPIKYNNKEIAFLIAGQFKDEKQKNESEQRMLECIKNYENKDDLIKKYKRVPILSEDKINALDSIVECIISTLWHENLIRINESPFIEQVNKYLLDNMSKNINVDQICKITNMSKNTVYKYFKKYFNDSITSYILKFKLEQAQTLLIKTNISVSTIASKCGFENYNYFSRVFRQNFGIPPLKFRKISKQMQS